jgi:uncharacterized membrane protein YhhN
MNESNPAAPLLSNRNKALAVIGLMAAGLFIAGHALDLYWLRMIAKPIPVLLMALWVYLLADKGVYRWAIIVGLLLSMLGDILLEASPETFIFGLVAFLLGHIAYIVAFTRDGRRLYPGRALLTYGYGVVLFVVFLTQGDLGDMMIPILLYVIVITTMLWRAASRVGVAGIQAFSARAGLLGAILFTFSDTLIALNMFVWDLPQPWTRYVIIGAYWLGQLGIMLSARQDAAA